MIPDYPEQTEFSIDLRDELHPLFQNLEDGISEFTFANIYLFRIKNSYRVSRIGESNYVITGNRDGASFFLLPFGLPEKKLLDELFSKHSFMKLASVAQAGKLRDMGYCIKQDRDNFDYLHLRDDLAFLKGRKYHKKRNLVTLFEKNYEAKVVPLSHSTVPDALFVLERWRETHPDPGDYIGGREALEKIGELKLCGNIVYIDNRPAAYTLGEELKKGTNFVIHFEKAESEYKGIYQYINKVFASSLPGKYTYINREQDMGDSGLRQAKMSYRPVGFIRKYKIWKN
ncbi:MAG: DUF2156 domain-containing protein [Spirochaetales bacterium]|nr:DUF2156 domain-containing protein [Spirochaetales bacterium]